MPYGPGRLTARPVAALSLPPSLDLNFLGSTLDPRITPTLRAGAGTAAAGWQYDGAGALVLGPHNLLLRSQEFDNASWAKTRVTVAANAATAPDGTLTADKIVPSTENNVHTIGPTTTVTGAAGQVWTGSVFGKAAELRNLRIRFATNLGFLADTVVNLTTGAHTAGNVAAQVIALPDGWVRVGLTRTMPEGATSLTFQLWPLDNAGAASYAGNASDGFLLWGAMLEPARAMRPYVPTTTAAAYGGARIDHDPATLQPRGLLIEGARTNLFLNSAAGATQSVTVTAAAHTLSFSGTGTITLTGTSTAGPLVGTSAANRVSLTFTPTAGSLTLTVSGTCTDVQLELGGSATSPIATAGSAVTRAADTATLSLANGSYDVLVQDRAGAEWRDAVAVAAGTYSLTPRTGQTTIARARLYAAGQVPAGLKTALQVAA